MMPTTCPACHGPLYRSSDDLSPYEACERRCKFEYSVRFIGESAHASYVNFKFEKLFATVYYDNEGTHWPSNVMHLYSRGEMKEFGHATPIAYVKGFIPDFSDLKTLEEKLTLYATFS